MKRQKISRGEHLQLALPRRPAPTSALSHLREWSNCSPLDPNSEKEKKAEEDREKSRGEKKKSTDRKETVPRVLKLSSLLFAIV